MQASTELIAFVKRHEGRYLVAYRDVVGVLTIGYGHTGLDIVPGQRITSAQADALLIKDLAKFERNVAAVVKVALNQSQFDALVSFSFNVGINALNSSTLLKKLNGGDYAGAAAEFLRWNRAGGRVILGLTNRRINESRLFKTGAYL